MDNKMVSRALTYYTALNGKTQVDIVNDLGFASSTVSQWFSGRNIPRIEALITLADYLKIDVSDFLRDPNLFNGENFSADAKLVSDVLANKPALYELFKSALSLQDKDLETLIGLSNRFNDLYRV
jgi:transcriptional regulator with XRE-family HTH domain